MNTCQQTNLFKKKNKKMEIFILGGVALENMMNRSKHALIRYCKMIGCFLIRIMTQCF